MSVYVLRIDPRTGKQAALLVVHGKGAERVECSGFGCERCNPQQAPRLNRG